MSEKPVGYGNPPKHSRFPKGRSGNPGGRKKGSRNFKTVLNEIMKSEVEFSENGKKRKLEVREAILWKQAELGLKGDWRAGANLYDRYERYSLDKVEPERELPEEDERMLDQYLERNSSPLPSQDDPEDQGG